MDSTKPLVGQRGWQYVNGVQIESFPHHNHFDRLSESFLHLRLWTNNVTTKPALSYAFSKVPTTAYENVYLDDGSQTNFRFRIGLAVDCLLGMPHPFLSLRHLNFDPANKVKKNKKNRGNASVFFWDEYFGGDLNKTGWLGKPTGDIRRHDNNFSKVSNLLDIKKAHWKVNSKYTAKTTIQNSNYEIDIQKIKEPILPETRRFLANLVIPLYKKLNIENEYTVVFDVQGDDNWNYKGETFKKVPRAIAIQGVFGYKENDPVGVLIDSKWRTMQFSFQTNQKSKNNIEFGCGEQIGVTHLKNIRLYKGAIGGHWSREFEHGLVLLNTTNTPWKFQLSKNIKYRRLKGKQSPKVNNGKRIFDNIIIPAKDAIFLIRE